VFTENKQQINRLALKKVVLKVQSKLGSAKKTELINSNIAQLGGSL